MKYLMRFIALLAYLQPFVVGYAIFFLNPSETLNHVGYVAFAVLAVICIGIEYFPEKLSAGFTFWLNLIHR